MKIDANKVWLSADYHLGEDRLDIMGRPFANTEEMVKTLIDNHNYLVDKDDCVIVVGDVCYKETPEYLHYVSQFNGRKILIRGNHDRVFTDEQLKPYFSTIIKDGEGLKIEIEGIPCYFTHYPTCGKNDCFNVCGHIHSAFKYQLNMFNCGVDVNHFRPVQLSKIPFHFKAICEYYDEDVWCAYNDINKQFLGKRGKKGTYFVK